MQVVTVTPFSGFFCWVPIKHWWVTGYRISSVKMRDLYTDCFLEMMNFNRKTHGFVGNARILLIKAPMLCGFMFSQYSHLVVQPITGKEDQKNNGKLSNVPNIFQFGSGWFFFQGLEIQFHQHLSEKHPQVSRFQTVPSDPLPSEPRHRANGQSSAEALAAAETALLRSRSWGWILCFGDGLTDVKSRGRCGRIEYINICIYI